MKHLKLIRITPKEKSEKGTFGVYIYDGIPFAVTLEPPWRDNKQDESCILDGDYILKRIVSPKYGDVFEITNVPGRTHVLNHWGNKLENTLGCVLIAEKYSKLNGEPAVLTSRNSPGEGFNEFMTILKGESEALLSISWAA